MKKLFSYLLISSMVILSSCTNYDDQFDDLNTQINSLKSQIEGFNSLSSGLTSLQGTVAALQTTVNALPKTATPATDISGLEASVAALQAALSGAATSAEVAALTADLAATQTALNASIAANATATAAAQTALEAALATAQATNTTATAAITATLADLEADLAAAATATEVAAISTSIAANQAALVLAIGENATAAADNATEIEKLATSLATLSETIAAIKTSLATVSTAEEVSALAADLVSAQSTLDILLAQSSFYNGDISITNQAELDFVNSLGNKVNVVQGKVTITQNVDMNEVTLTAVMSRFITVTKEVTYTSTDSKTTQLPFANLIGTASLTIDQAGDISLPKLASVNGTLTLSGDEATGQDITKTVSLPLLTSVTGAMTFNNIGKATTLSLPTMVEHDNAITITIDKTGTVDLSAFTNATVQSTGVANDTPEALVVTAAKLTAPVYSQGAITGNTLTSVDLPKWKYKDGSSFAKALTVVLPSVDPEDATSSFSIAINSVFPEATSVHIVAAANDHTGVKTNEHVNVTSTSAELETLILGGTFSDVTITSGAELSSMTFDGSALTVQVSSTDIETLDIPYTQLVATTGETESLNVSNNAKLLSLSADKVNGLGSFTLTSNADLATISFDALEDAATLGATVSVSGNDLTIESINDAQTAPVVAEKWVSADLTVLKSFIVDAISKIGTTANTVDVDVDAADIVVAYDLNGDERSVSSDDQEVVNFAYVETDAEGGTSQIEEMYISSLGSGSPVFKVENSQGVLENISILTNTGLNAYYDIKAWAESAATKSALTAAGLSIVGETAYPGERTATFEFADATLTNVSAIVNFSAGVEILSVTTGSASTTTEIADALEDALNLGFGTVSQYYDVTRSEKELTFTSLAKGSHRQTFDFTWSAYTISGGVASDLIGGTSASVTTDESIEATTGAYIKFKSNALTVAGARTISLGTTGGTVTLLKASGVDTTTLHMGDDEAFTAPEDGILESAAVTTDRANKSVNNAQYLAAN